MYIKLRQITDFLLLTIIVLFCAVSAYGDRESKTICNFCREPIKSQYVEFDGKFYHPIHFLCDNCSRVIGTEPYYIKDNHKYCNKCYLEEFAPKCAYCGDPVEGEYIIYNGKEYHKFCYEFKVALRCALCGEVIQGEYLVDYWGNHYHKDHETDHHQCEYCGRFISEAITGGGTQYADGRHICNICAKSTVTKNRHALRLLEEVRDKLAIEGIYVTDKIILNLVGRNKLKKLTDNRMADPAGFTKYEWKSLLSATISSQAYIYILDGLPEIEFIATAAHEIMHVWQYADGKKNNLPALCEGSCNYATYLVLQHYPADETAYKLENMEDDPHEYYGEGYRRVKKMVADKGIDFWLEHLKKEKGFPKGY